MEEIININTALTTFVNYREYKEAFDAETERMKVGFVRIGYLLRIAEDTDILKESGYANMEEFAWKEYHIDASQASRFKNINKRFSIDGYSDRLQERFQGYGVAKLGELLTLSDEIIETLPPELTRSEIKEVKKEVAEEQKITDLEVMMEPPEGEGSNLEKWMDVYFRESPEDFLKIKSMYLHPDKAQAVMDILAPSGIAAKTARIKGAGKFLLSIKGKELPIELLNIRTNEKETYSLEDCFRAMKEVCPYTAEPKKIYEARYGQPFPEEGKIAPVQPGKTDPQSTGTSNKTLGKPDQKLPKPEQKPEKTEQEAGKPEQGNAETKETTGFTQEETNKPSEKLEEETSGIAQVQPPEAEKAADNGQDVAISTQPQAEEWTQMDIEDIPEALPEGYIRCHDGSEVKESLWEEAERMLSEVYQIFVKRERERLNKASDYLFRLANITLELQGTPQEQKGEGE